jgi:hypothetical protein
MKVTFNDDETRRILKEFAAVNHNRIQRTRTVKGASKSQNKTVAEYSKILDSWVKEKLKNIYHAEISKCKQ